MQKAVAAGRITLKAGKVDVSAADTQWAGSSGNRQDEPLGPPLTGRRRGERRDTGTRPPPDEGAVTYATARAEREHYRAKRERLEYEREQGLVVNAADFRIKFSRLITEAKMRLLGVPTQCRARVSGLSVADVSIIELLIRQALEDLADGKTAESEQ